jgi:hypothetical protein
MWALFGCFSLNCTDLRALSNFACLWLYHENIIYSEGLGWGSGGEWVVLRAVFVPRNETHNSHSLDAVLDIRNARHFALTVQWSWAKVKVKTAVSSLLYSPEHIQIAPLEPWEVNVISLAVIHELSITFVRGGRVLCAGSVGLENTVLWYIKLVVE